MKKNHIENTRLFHERDYKTEGLAAQRNYPNEEFCRFMGRHFFSCPAEDRSEIKILETGSGTGANLWMIASEGFDAYGLDISEQGLNLCEKRLARMNLTVKLSCSSMTSTDYENDYFDAVIDVFSSHCLKLVDKKQYISEVTRILKKGGLFFSYHPSKNSDAFKDHAPSSLIDECTLDGIHRKGSAFYQYENSFSFLSTDDYKGLAHDADLSTISLEKIGRTYRDQQEYFEFLSAVFIKE